MEINPAPHSDKAGSQISKTEGFQTGALNFRPPRLDGGDNCADASESQAESFPALPEHIHGKEVVCVSY